jgi:hypothetical protein
MLFCRGETHSAPKTRIGMKNNTRTNNMNIEKIREHYEHAKEKHPYFCDNLRKALVYVYCEARAALEQEGEVKI